jgi:lantibiotic biosynthesis protein
VALFLAQLFAVTDDLAVRRTALGGIWQALERAEAVALHRSRGFYTGWAGLVFVAARLSSLLCEEALLDRARQLVYSAANVDDDSHEFDLLAGSAGTIAGLVALRGIIEGTFCLDFAERLADELLQAADKSAAGYSWRSSGLPANCRLTGFSHGTAGIGYALLELFQATGASKYREAAIQAFQYERYWFDARTGNWPDFRRVSAPGKRNKRHLTFATHWCHGAPGIALSRLRAYELMGDEVCKAEAITALHTTHEALKQALQSGPGDFSLCHGLAGNAEALRYGFRVLGPERAQDEALAAAVAQVGRERYATRPGAPWPGETGGETPGLMLGLAGTGYFYLRLNNAAIPSILIPRYEDGLVPDVAVIGSRRLKHS